MALSKNKVDFRVTFRAQANEQEAESERLLGWRRLQKNFENNASSVHPDVINRPDVSSSPPRPPRLSS
eukprot:2425789-Rhodomonas_salina.1